MTHIKRGKRQGRQSWRAWRDDLPNWTLDELNACYLLADKAYGSRSIRAQYVALDEMNHIRDEIERRGVVNWKPFRTA